MEANRWMVLGTAVLLLFFFVSAAHSACPTVAFGNNKYNVDALYKAMAGNDMHVPDPNKQEYYYALCNSPKQAKCPAGSAVCQIDNNGNPHNCGNLATITITQRAQGADQGYILGYTGGEDNRKSQIEFICDKTATEVGTFSFVTEVPNQLFYQLSWYKDPRPPLLLRFERVVAHPPPNQTA